MKRFVAIVAVVMLAASSLMARSMADFGPAKHAGTRRDPIPALDGYAEIEYQNPLQFRGSTAVLRIGVSGVIRGDNANAMVKAGNMYNKAPAAGSEYALVYAYISNIKDLTGKDDPATVSTSAFKVVDSRFKRYDSSNYVIMDGMIDAEVYEGGEAEGWVVCVVPKGEIFYLQIGEVWFKLNAVSDPYSQL